MNNDIVIITRELKGKDLIYRDILRSKGLTLLQHKVIDLVKDEHRVSKVVELILNSRYDYILFMSSNAVEFIAEGLRSRGLEPNVVNDKAYIVAVGPSTRDELLNNGIRVDLMPNKYSSYGIVEMFKGMECYGKSILIPRSNKGSNILVEGLGALGMHVHEEYIYKIVPSMHEGWRNIADILKHNDYRLFIIFTSSSIVDTFFKVLHSIGKDVIGEDNLVCIAIGPLTYQALLRHGLDARVADEHTIAGTFKLLLNLLNDNTNNIMQ